MKHPALEAHICPLNDGAQSCTCFLAGWESAQKEKRDMGNTNCPEIQDSSKKEYYDRGYAQGVVDTDALLRKKIEEIVKEHIKWTDEQTEINKQYLIETKKRDIRIAELEEALKIYTSSNS